MASGDDAYDAEVENAILKRLGDGDEWSWCTVCVVATIGEYEGRAYLGGCSYEGEDDFKTGGYWESMKDDALSELKAELEREAKHGEEAAEILKEIGA
jgi:hypothetical protein